jgi:hypothetical protein
MKTVYIQGATPVREDSDLWTFFVEDSAGVYGLFRGEFWNRLVKEEPRYKPTVIKTLLRGLRSDFATERYNALRTMEHLASSDGMIAMREEFEKDPYRFVGVESPDSDCPTLYAAWCRAVPCNASEADGEGARAALLAEPFLFVPDIDYHIFGLFYWYQPSILNKHLTRALEYYAEDLLTGYLEVFDNNQCLEAAASLKPIERLRDRFISVLWKTRHWDVREEDFRSWRSIVLAAGLAADFVPEGHSGRFPHQLLKPVPVSDELAQQIADDIDALAQGRNILETPPPLSELPLPSRVVIAPEAFVTASLMMGSPATALFNRLTELRGTVVMAFSDWTRSEIVAGLEQSGMSRAKAESHADFIVSLGEKFSTTAEANPLAALAHAAGTDVAYVTGDSGNIVDGVRMAPIHELITLVHGRT